MKSTPRIPLAIAGLVLVTLLSTHIVSGQSSIHFSGRVYADYSYVIGSPDHETEGDNGFGYRRAYLTTKYSISDRFSGRFRLETNDGSTNAQGKDAPFVKDLYLKWTNALGNGHNLTFCVSSPPAFLVSEAHWGHRSLEKTILDRSGIVKSRDMGISLDGPVTSNGTVRYGVMLANNNNVNGENDRNKRVYGQLEFYPGSWLRITVGGDYAARDDGHSVTVHGFVGYQGEGFRIGGEGFYSPLSFNGIEDNETRTGGTLFIIAEVTETNTAIFRIDRLETDILGITNSETWALVGYSFHLDKNVQLIPNVIYEKDSEADDPFINGRLTLYYKF